VGRPALRVVGVRDAPITGAEVPCIRYAGRDVAIKQSLNLLGNEDIVDDAM
jgi:hypothetical protein